MRIWNPTSRLSLPSARLPISITRLAPGTSTATGFSQYACLPAATTASRCSGMEIRRRRDLDGIDVLRFDDPLVAVGPAKQLRRRRAVLLPVFACSSSKCARPASSWSAKRSASAVTRTPALVTKPLPTSVPRPPTPRMPSRTAELAWLPRTDCGLTMVKPAVVAAVALRNSRRPIVRVFCVMRALRSGGGYEARSSVSRYATARLRSLRLLRTSSTA